MVRFQGVICVRRLGAPWAETRIPRLTIDLIHDGHPSPKGRGSRDRVIREGSTKFVPRHPTIATGRQLWATRGLVRAFICQMPLDCACDIASSASAQRRTLVSATHCARDSAAPLGIGHPPRSQSFAPSIPHMPHPALERASQL